MPDAPSHPGETPLSPGTREDSSNLTQFIRRTHKSLQVTVLLAKRFNFRPCLPFHAGKHL
jgi:hypothetical protein